jgi:predicted RNA methylase
MQNRYHCCATCRHFSAQKREGGGMVYHCVRLGFETKATYAFHCWDPKDHVKKLMKKQAHSSS